MIVFITPKVYHSLTWFTSVIYDHLRHKNWSCEHEIVASAACLPVGSNIQYHIFNIQYFVFNIQNWQFNVQNSSFNIQYFQFNVQCLAFKASFSIQYTVFNIQCFVQYSIYLFHFGRVFDKSFDRHLKLILLPTSVLARIQLVVSGLWSHGTWWVVESVNSSCQQNSVHG